MTFSMNGMYRIVSGLMYIAVTAASVSGCAAQSGVKTSLSVLPTIQYIETEEVRPLQLKGEVFLIHLGDIDEYDIHHIPGAVPRNLSEIYSLAQLPATKPIVVYEPGFGRIYSVEVQKLLAQNEGRIKVMRGGLVAWERKGFPIEGHGFNDINWPCHPVTADALERALRDQTDFTLIDLRQEIDYQSAHIPGALHAGPENIGKILKTISNLQWVILYDERGPAAERVGEEVTRAGFNYCGYLSGGYAAWDGTGKIMSPGQTK